MSSARFATALLIAAGVSVSFSASSFAGDASDVKKGNVSVDDFRIRRAAAPAANKQQSAANKKLYATVEKNKVLPQTKALVPQTPTTDSLIQADDFATPPPVVRAPLPANAVINTQAPRPESKYVWGQSAAGGYFDATGQIKNTVMGDELYKYGGKFMDSGKLVPTMPVVCNFKGHVYFPYVPKRSP